MNTRNMTDEEILEVVSATIAEADGNWADALDVLLDTHAEDRYASDAWYIGTLPDGRTIWLRDESARGADQYGIDEEEG